MLSNRENSKVVEEVKKVVHSEISDNKILGKIIAALVTVITTCAIAMVTFIWELKSDIPVMKKSISDANSAYGTMQGSLNNIRMDQQYLRDNQIRMEEHLKNIEKKLDLN